MNQIFIPHELNVIHGTGEKAKPACPTTELIYAHAITLQVPCIQRERSRAWDMAAGECRVPVISPEYPVVEVEHIWIVSPKRDFQLGRMEHQYFPISLVLVLE